MSSPAAPPTWPARTARLLSVPSPYPTQPEYAPAYPAGQLWRSVLLHAVRGELAAGAPAGRRVLRIDYPGLDALALYEHPAPTAGAATADDSARLLADADALAARVHLRILRVPPHACTSLVTGHIMHALLHAPDLRAHARGEASGRTLAVDSQYPYLALLRPDVLPAGPAVQVLPVQQLLAPVLSVSAAPDGAGTPVSETPNAPEANHTQIPPEAPDAPTTLNVPPPAPSSVSVSSSLARGAELPTGFVHVVVSALAYVADAAGLLRALETTAAALQDDADVEASAPPILPGSWHAMDPRGARPVPPVAADPSPKAKGKAPATTVTPGPTSRPDGVFQLPTPLSPSTPSSSTADISGQFSDAPDVDASLSTLDSPVGPRTPSSPAPPQTFTLKTRISLARFTPSATAVTFSSPTAASRARSTFRRSLDFVRASPGATARRASVAVSAGAGAGAGAKVEEHAPKDAYRPRGYRASVVPPGAKAEDTAPKDVYRPSGFRAGAKAEDTAPKDVYRPWGFRAGVKADDIPSPKDAFKLRASVGPQAASVLVPGAGAGMAEEDGEEHAQKDAYRPRGFARVVRWRP